MSSKPKKVKRLRPGVNLSILPSVIDEMDSLLDPNGRESISSVVEDLLKREIAKRRPRPLEIPQPPKSHRARTSDGLRPAPPCVN